MGDNENVNPHSEQVSQLQGYLKDKTLDDYTSNDLENVKNAINSNPDGIVVLYGDSCYKSLHIKRQYHQDLN